MEAYLEVKTFRFYIYHHPFYTTDSFHKQDTQQMFRALAFLKDDISKSKQWLGPSKHHILQYFHHHTLY